MAEIDGSVDLCARARRLPGAQEASGCLPACRNDQGACRWRLRGAPEDGAMRCGTPPGAERQGRSVWARGGTPGPDRGRGAHAFAAADCGHAARGTETGALCAAKPFSAALACPPMASIYGLHERPGCGARLAPARAVRIMALPVRLPAQPQRMSLSALPALSSPMTQFLDAVPGRGSWTRPLAQPLKRFLKIVGASCRPLGLAKEKGGFASGCGKGARPSSRGERLSRLPRSCRAVWGRPALSGAVRA